MVESIIDHNHCVGTSVDVTFALSFRSKVCWTDLCSCRALLICVK